MDTNLKREKPADMLRVEAAYCGDEIVGLRITADDPAHQLLVWADNSVMNGFRIGNEFIAGWDKKIEYRDVAIGEPEPAAPATAITSKPDEWDVRGHLAASLTFWHRMKGEEADELVAALQSWATPAQPAPQGVAYAELPAGTYFAKSVDGKQHNTGKVCIKREPGHPGGWNYFASTASPEDAQAIADAMNSRTAVLRPVETGALAASIQELEAWESRADGELLTQSEGESVMLVLHELKRLRASNGQAPAGAKSARHYGPLRDADAEYGKTLSVYAPTAQAAPAGTTLPEGWVSLTITHEGQYAEEVAYGPQRMMARLDKWLCKYFAKTAAPAQMPDLQPLHNLLYLAQRQNSLGAMRCAITEARLELAKVRDGQKH